MMIFRKILISKTFLYLYLAVLSGTLLLLLNLKQTYPPSAEKFSSNFSRQIRERQARLEQELLSFSDNYFSAKGQAGFPSEKNKQSWQKNGFSFLVYQPDSLVYWTDHRLSIPSRQESWMLTAKVKRLQDGWYLTAARKEPSKSLVLALALIKHEYPYENEYLQNDYHPFFHADAGDVFSVNPGGQAVKDALGNTILYISPSASRQVADWQSHLNVLLYLLAFIFFSLFMYYLAGIDSAPREQANTASSPWHELVHRHQFLFFLAFCADVILLRALLFYFKWPAFIYTSSLFSPADFAVSVYLPSLGDLLLNSLILFFLSILFFKLSFTRKGLPPDSSTRWPVLGVVTLLLPFLFFLYTWAFPVLIQNSSFTLSVSDPLNLSSESLLAYIVLASLSVSFFFLFVPMLRFILLSTKRWQALFLLGFAVCALYFLLMKNELPLLLPMTVFIFFSLLLSLLIRLHKNPYSLSFLLLYIVCSGFYATGLIIQLEREKEIAQREMLVQKLSSERDPLAEFLITEIDLKMQQDSLLAQLLFYGNSSEYQEDAVIQYITRKYFSNYWEKYSLDFTLCPPNRLLNVIVPYNTQINCLSFFDQLIQNIGKPSIPGKLYSLDYGTGTMNYLALFRFSPPSVNNSPELNLYLEITSKRIPKGLGYPELLVSKESRLNPDLNRYSWALYHKNSLLRSFGKFAYPHHLLQKTRATATAPVFLLNGYNHLMYTIDPDKFMLLSLKKPGFLENIAPFSLLSVLAGLLTLLSFVLLSKKGSLHYRNQHLVNRLQFSMILLVLFSFLVIGAASTYYIIQLNRNKNESNLTEKAHSILIEVQQKMGHQAQLSEEAGKDLFYLLNKFSLIFFTDINIFDLKGKLIASSRPSIFEEGLLSTRMNRESLEAMTVDQKSFYLHEDKIGNYSFLSAYLPFRNEQDQCLGYINLPYFARQDEIRSELSVFIITFINIYILLIAFSILLAIGISRYITKPLLLIRDKISRVKLGKSNEKIDWPIDDEIGSLVKEYNLMIDQLASSAEQLAQSERESAWREMARQVAHEIRNPLTPMKLSVQLLLKAYQEGEKDWEGRLKRFSNSLIEQIDNLSHIASGFSDFARMPELQKEQLVFQEIIKSVIDLYSDNAQVSIQAELPALPALVHADRNQLIRVLVNLFKNSFQALEGKGNAYIKLKLLLGEDQCQLEFSDNGSGIPTEQINHIFSPNFTTKTGGMGLGLAMVKSIVEDHGGNIRFTSEAGSGTTFYLHLPLARA